MKFALDVENYRIKTGIYGSEPGNAFGAFVVPFRSAKLTVVACDGRVTGWDHVSVSLRNRCPNWDEMSFIKSLFFDDEETVIQYHPKKSEYVNQHPYCLHLWRPYGADVPLPPKELVGFTGPVGAEIAKYFGEHGIVLVK